MLLFLPLFVIECISYCFSLTDYSSIDLYTLFPLPFILLSPFFFFSSLPFFWPDDGILMGQKTFEISLMVPFFFFFLPFLFSLPPLFPHYLPPLFSIDKTAVRRLSFPLLFPPPFLSFPPSFFILLFPSPFSVQKAVEWNQNNLPFLFFFFLCPSPPLSAHRNHRGKNKKENTPPSPSFSPSFFFFF